MIMKINGMTARWKIAVVGTGCALGGLTIGLIGGAPSAVAAPDCSPAGVSGTVSSVTGSARHYLDAHPGANQAVSAAYDQPHDQAAANLRSYFTAHPQEYNDLHGILAPIGDTERQCNVAALPPNLESAYHEFMAG
jgi:hemophore-related protein